MKKHINTVIFFLMLLVFALLYVNIKEDEESILPAWQIEERAKMERLKAHFNYDGSHKGLVKLVKDNMHNPKSFEHVETKYLEKDEKILLWMTYRGTNGFGATVTNTQNAIADYDGSILFVE
jgi:hypothetical protein